VRSATCGGSCGFWMASATCGVNCGVAAATAAGCAGDAELAVALAAAGVAGFAEGVPRAGGGPGYGCGCGPRLFGGQIDACCRWRLHHARGGCNRPGDGGGFDNGGHRRRTRAQQGGIHAQRRQRFGHGGTRSQRQQGEQ
jgi:hypothetical protein